MKMKKKVKKMKKKMKMTVEAELCRCSDPLTAAAPAETQPIHQLAVASARQKKHLDGTNGG